jgi:hypothetical protein
MIIGRLSSAVLMLSGMAGIVSPRAVGSALDLAPGGARGIAETRAGLGGTYAALGGWASVSRDPAAEIAVGVTWLGAAAVRIASLAVDRPRTNLAFWSYLGLEIGCGVSALASAHARSRSLGSGASTRHERRSAVSPEAASSAASSA